MFLRTETFQYTGFTYCIFPNQCRDAIYGRLCFIWAIRIKKFSLLGVQPHDAVVSCGCRFAVLAKFRGKINLPNKVIVYVNALGAMAAGLIRGVDNYLFHKLTQKRRGQLGGFSVLLYNPQKILDIDSLGFRLGYSTPQFLRRLFQIRLFLFVALGQPGKPLYAQRPRHTILIKLLNNAVKFADAPLLLFQLALGPLLFGTLCRRLILHDAPHKLVLVILCVGHNTLQVLEYKFFQYHGPDIMGGALLSGAIICTSVTLLFFCKRNGAVVVQLCSAVSAVGQPREKSHFAQLGRAAALLPIFLYDFPCLLINNRFVGALKYRPFVWGIDDCFLALIGEFGGLEIRCAA